MSRLTALGARRCEGATASGQQATGLQGLCDEWLSYHELVLELAVPEYDAHKETGLVIVLS